MAIGLDEQALKRAFQGRDDIQSAIKNASSAGPHYIELFNQISQHVCTLTADDNASEPASKKRRLDDLASRPATNGHATTNGDAGSSSATAKSTDTVLLEIKDISVVIPQRKKYTLCFTSTHIYARLPNSPEPFAGCSFAWSDIEYAFCLPVPDKTAKQYNYILFPKNSTITPSKPSTNAPPTPETLVFTIPHTAPKPGTITGAEANAAAAVSDEYKTLFDWALSTRLKIAGKGSKEIKIIEADPKVFNSEIRQAQRPSEKATHVAAFRGSKDGYLFFLPNGILWGFKKPMMFLPHERIMGVSYVNVLQRTFNLEVEVGVAPAEGQKEGGEDEGESTEVYEFAMLDQEDFGGIDGFVKRHGLMDRSMAEQRKAKRLNVNVVKDEEGNVVGNAEAGELERAEREAGGGGAIGDLEEEDSEDEEDYDPGSDADSEGEGTSSEEDGEGGGEDGGEEGEDDDDGDGDGEEDEL